MGIYPSLAAIDLRDLQVNGSVYIKFNDIRDAGKATSYVQHHLKRWRVSPIDPRQFTINNPSHSMNTERSLIYEGQLLATASYTEMANKYEANTMTSIVKGALHQCGELMAFSIHSTRKYELCFRAEFYDVRSASNAILNLNNVQIKVMLSIALRRSSRLISIRCAP